MSGEIMAADSLLLSIFNKAAELKKINDAVVRNEGIIELQEDLLNARLVQTKLIARVIELERELTHLKNSKNDKDTCANKTQLTKIKKAQAIKPSPIFAT